ncbi:MAG: hypothetical protein AUI88_01500 [Gemmatimonadetes bacterium 13_1_40CM_3_70_8]|nr:MAG: hypothetical protein AUI88_01500 [Gemmatimonadetes bacterium 13_1_40CM_3_70_8]
MSAARSQNSTTLGSAITCGASSALSLESRGTNPARSTESAAWAVRATPRAWQAATHPSPSNMTYFMEWNIFER